MASACEVSTGSQINYEKEDNSPGIAYLKKAAALGIDVNYVITGVRASGGMVQEAAVSYMQPNERELEVLKAWRALDETGKRAIETTIKALRR